MSKQKLVDYRAEELFDALQLVLAQFDWKLTRWSPCDTVAAARTSRER